MILLLASVLDAAPLGALAEETSGKGDATEQEWSGVSLDQYTACIDGALRNPEPGFEDAIAWRDMGGGAPAKHCVAVALYALGQHTEAAKRLEDLARDGDTLSPELRTSLLGQAGQAWMSASDYSRAYAALTAALKIAPNDIALLLERSLAAAGAESYFDAIDDLNRIIEQNPDHTDALAFRAAAYRHLGSLDLASDDVERALSVNPSHLGALLERGNLRMVRGDADGARKDWVRILALAPESAEADAARVNIEEMDIKTP